MRNIADVTGGKPIDVLLQPISSISANNPLVAFSTSMEERERCYFFYFVPDTTRDYYLLLNCNFICFQTAFRVDIMV
jgi:hypothetical protein